MSKDCAGVIGIHLGSADVSFYYVHLEYCAKFSAFAHTVNIISLRNLRSIKFRDNLNHRLKTTPPQYHIISNCYILNKKSNNKHNSPELFQIDGSNVSDKETIANKFNIFKKNSCGIDEIATKLLKTITQYITKSTTFIINQSLSSGVFPDKLKIAKIVPTIKKNDPTLLDNYRSISLLRVFSKIFERGIFDQLHNHFNLHNRSFKSVRYSQSWYSFGQIKLLWGKSNCFITF